MPVKLVRVDGGMIVKGALKNAEFCLKLNGECHYKGDGVIMTRPGEDSPIFWCNTSKVEGTLQREGQFESPGYPAKILVTTGDDVVNVMIDFKKGATLCATFQGTLKVNDVSCCRTDIGGIAFKGLAIDERAEPVLSILYLELHAMLEA